MDKKEKSPEQELVESIVLMVDNGMASSTKIYSGIVKNSDGKTAQVTMNGQDQNVAVCPSDLVVGSIARVFVPGGNMSNAFILGSVSGSGGGDTPTPTKKNDGVAGTYDGTDEPSKSLTFEFEPRFVIIMGVSTSGSSSKLDEIGFMVKNCPFAYIHTSYSTDRYTSVTWGSNSVSWFSSDKYLNGSYTKYYYFAI